MSILWMPHAGHLLIGQECQFRLTTYVNGYIVSTVGEWVPDSQVRRIIRETAGRQTTLLGDAEKADFGFAEIGYQRTYETMVFPAKASSYRCCPYTAASWSELDMAGYTDAGDAYDGHLRMVAKYTDLDGRTVRPDAVREGES